MTAIITLTHTVLSLTQRGAKLLLLGLATLSPLLAAACAPAAGPTPQQESTTSEFATVEGEIDAEISPDTIPPREPSECPALDSQLFQLTQADDPPRLAEQLGFAVRDGKVQVLIVLQGGDSAFLQDFGVEPGDQSGNELQAYAPFDQLCNLANSAQVAAVRPAAQPIP